MKSIFCYYKKSIDCGNSNTPVQSIVYQDKVLLNYCASKNFYVLKRFSDLGYLGSPFRRPELLQMKLTMEKPKNKVDLLVFYSIEAVKRDLKINETLLLEVVKQIGSVHFYNENLTMDYEEFQLHINGKNKLKLFTFQENFRITLEKKEKA